ncbi:TonB-dependent receptor [Cupriavidus nantongensis]|uniref:Energy transducer TonB n=1 Tax=Cupriavidus nantongensis TaxID=1796606 RepID=A0A142JG74_9BURK|nr:TonB-dependent siderophore receptor [Cupriavidus nantongensis]AMR77086.1 energy transducer TonB [Cupriavidus nantongensis]
MGVLATFQLHTVSAQESGAADGVTAHRPPAPTLPQVTVSASAEPDQAPPPYAGGQVARGGRLGMLGDTTIMKAPFNLTSYTAELIENQQSATVAEALSKDPSVRATGLAGANIDTFYIRGFPINESNSGEIAFNGLYGIAPSYRVFTDYAERVEVLKGPAALLYGMSPNSGVGGVINIVPKRAGEDLTRFTASYASDTQFGGHLDVARRFGEDREWGIRANGSYYNGDTTADNQSRKAPVGALALDYRGKQLRASLDVLAQQERIDAPGRPLMISPGLQVPGASDGRRNVTQPWEYSKGREEAVLFHAEYDLNDSLTAFASAGGGWSRVDRVFGTTPMITNAQGDTLSTPTFYKFKVDRGTFDGGVRARFATGAVKHAVTLQASAYTERFDRAFTSGTPVASNIYDPVTQPAQNLQAPSTVPRFTATDLSGVALSDTMSFLDERVLLTLGLRQQRVRTRNYNQTSGAVSTYYDESATTPMVGLVVQPVQRWSVYANYIQGLSRGDVAPPTASNAGEAFAPYKADQYEIGTKLDFGRFTTTLAAFQIAKPTGQLDNNVFSVNGEQRNRGLEFNVFGEVVPRVRLLGGVMLIDGEITRSPVVANVGKTAIGVPDMQANLGAEWDLPWVPGLTLTGAMLYTGRQYVNQANTASLPAWTRFDFGARYTTRIGGKATTFRANVLNVFDRDYWAGVTSWGGFSLAAPRTVLMSATVDF